MSTFTRKINYLTIWFLLGVFSIGAHAVASEFYKEVASSATPTDYETLISFSPPVGAGTGRQTYIKFVTDTALADLNFRIEPQNPGVNGNRSPVDIQVLGTGGADAVPKSMAEDDALATTVVNTMLAQEVTGTNVASGYKMILVRLDYADTYTFPALAETWQLKVKETTNDREYFGFAGETDTEVTQPRIEPLPPIAFGEVQQEVSSKYAPVMPVNVRNIGTSTLTITGAPISSNPTPIFFTVDVLAPQPLDPGGSMDNVYDEDASDGKTEKKGIWVMASPGNLEERSSMLTLESATGDSEVVTLTAAGVNLYAHILMDVSASMGWHPDGSSTVSDPDQDSRLAKAKEAGQEINNWIKDFSDGRAYLGLSTFPDSFTSADSDIVVGIGRSQNTHQWILDAFGPQNLNGLKHRNGTPMDTGIIAAIGDMDARINDPLKPPSSAERPDLKQAILLLSDGGENPSSNARGQLGVLDSKDILMYTIGYGTGNVSVDHVLLKDLANGVTLNDGTKGAFFDANSLDAFALKKAFKNAVTDWLGLRTIVDPEGTIRRGTTKTHTVCIDDSIYGLTFSVDWDRHVSGGVQLTLTSPTGEVITPQSSDISYYDSDSFAMYIIRGKRLRGGQGAGEWTMKLTGGNGIPVSADTHYSYNVHAQSPVITQPKFSFESLGTAMEFLFELQMAHLASDRLNNLKVTVDIDAPAESLESYLVKDPLVRQLLFDSPVMTSGNANAQSTTEAYKPHTGKVVPKIIMGETASSRQRMAYALAHFADKPFTNKRATQSVELYDDGTHGDRVAHDGIFSAKSPTIQYDGIYKWSFKVESIKPGRKACVNREFVVCKYADVALSSMMMASQLRSAEVTQQEILDPGIWEHLKEKVPAGYQRKAVVFTPKDAIGNSWGMGRAKQVAFSVENATTLGPVADNLDGSYVQVIQFKAGDSPKVRVNAGGLVSEPVTVVPPTPPYRWLIWLVIALVIIVIVYLVRRRNA
ncbi:MAG: VWA domain-containing protein [Deltaproteobacteria bacterium]|nr:VWA domain-containing protein [Deltaproteobacteria bacterium]